LLRGGGGGHPHANARVEYTAFEVCLCTFEQTFATCCECSRLVLNTFCTRAAICFVTHAFCFVDTI
jgi:hypothetical protein